MPRHIQREKSHFFVNQWGGGGLTEGPSASILIFFVVAKIQVFFF